MDNNVDVLAEFLLTPLREGRLWTLYRYCLIDGFLLTPLREGRLAAHLDDIARPVYFYSRPCGRGDQRDIPRARLLRNFYSRPCGRGDHQLADSHVGFRLISTHAPAGGATVFGCPLGVHILEFLLTPLREGRHYEHIAKRSVHSYFYSRPCGRGDDWRKSIKRNLEDFYSRPCGRGDGNIRGNGVCDRNFYSRPCGRGDGVRRCDHERDAAISTHAPAGGATAIFHKSVMRFCGKLPKDDTVLCLASFGFPRRDPKVVYLAWISCANLPQKCVREGLALKDQGTSCFHEGLASHAFDPVLV